MKLKGINFDFFPPKTKKGFLSRNLDQAQLLADLEESNTFW